MYIHTLLNTPSAVFSNIPFSLFTASIRYDTLSYYHTNYKPTNYLAHGYKLQYNLETHNFITNYTSTSLSTYTLNCHCADSLHFTSEGHTNSPKRPLFLLPDFHNFFFMQTNFKYLN